MGLNYYIGNRKEDQTKSLFTTAEKIDLFEEGKIMYKGKLVDAENIEAIFNDIVNTFTVPATKKNNRIFKNWFQIGVKDGLNPNIRVDSYIEYNTLPFRSGKTQLEEIRNKDGMLNSYGITFYGEITGLEDLFTLKRINEDTGLEESTGELSKLKDLDFSKYNFTYDERNIVALLTSPGLVLTETLNTVPTLIMPMIIPTDRLIEYNTGSTEDAKDITLDEGRLFLEDLRPAIRQTAIIEAIEEQYGITFSRDFIDTTDFTTLYTWLNRNEDGSNVFKWEALETSRDLGDEFLTFDFYNIFLKFNGGNLANETGVTSPNESYEINFEYKFWYKFPNETFFRIRLVNREGVVLNTSEITQGRGTTNPQIGNNGFFELVFNTQFQMIPNSEDEIDQAFQIEIQINDEMNEADGNQYYADMITTWKLADTSGTGTQIDDASALGGVRSILEILPTFTIARNMPDITVLGYLKNLIKEFKLIIRPISTTEFRLQNINDYYAEGNVIDITKYSDVNTEESVIYKNNKLISYNYAVEEDSALQEQFKIANDRYRGNAIKNFDVDNKKTTSIELTTEVPFFVRLLDSDTNRKTNINIALYNSQDSDGGVSKIYPENMLSFYYNGITPITNSDTIIPIKIDLLPRATETSGGGKTETNIIDILSVPICDSSNNYVVSQVTNNLDFSDTTVNGWHNVNLTKNIYNKNHLPWITNLLNPDSRITTVESVLQPNDINKIELNTQIIYKNNRYSIEDFEIDLITNETKFRLFPDFNNKYLISDTSINQTEFFFNADGGFSNIVIRTSEIIGDVTTDQSWIDISPLDGNRRVFNIPFFIKTNYKDTERNGIINITIGEETYVIDINQSKRIGSLGNTQLTISPDRGDFQSNLQQFEINVSSNGFWTIGDLPDEITLISDSIGFGNDVITLEIEENNTRDAISGTFIIFPLTEQSFSTYTYEQAGVDYIEVESTLINIGSASGFFSLQVNTNSSTNPVVTIEESFITLVNTSSNIDGYSYTFTVTENQSTTSDRDSEISFRIGADASSYLFSTTLVNQSKGVADITVIPSNVNLSFESQTYEFEVAANVAWEVSSNANWININTTSGNGNSTTVSITLLLSSFTERQAEVIVENSEFSISDTLQVTQASFSPGNPPNRPSTPITTITYLDDGDRIDLSWVDYVVLYDGIVIEYEVYRIDDGNRILIGTTETNLFTDFDFVGGDNRRYVVIAKVLYNQGTSSTDIRTSPESFPSINIPVDRKVILRPNFVNVSEESGSDTLQVISNTSWNITSNLFVSIPPEDNSGNGNKEVSFLYDDNIEFSRSANVTLNSNVGINSDLTLISQARFIPFISLSPNTIDFIETNPVNKSVSVESNSTWIVGEIPSWFTIGNGFGDGNGAFTIIPTTNSTGQTRSWILKVVANGNSNGNTTNDSIKVSQIGVQEQLTIIPEIKEINSNSQTYNITIESNGSWNLNIDAAYPWLTASEFSGTGNTNVLVSAGGNIGSVLREGIIDITTSDVSKTHTCRQAPILVGDLYEYIVSKGSTESSACSIGTNFTVYSENSSFAGSQTLYEDAFGNDTVDADFYSKGGIFIQTDSSGENIVSGLCSNF